MRRVPMTLRVSDLRHVAERDAEQVAGDVASIRRNLSRATSDTSIQETPSGSLPMPPANARKHAPAKGRGAASQKPSARKELVLHGDVEALNRC